MHSHQWKRECQCLQIFATKLCNFVLIFANWLGKRMIHCFNLHFFVLTSKREHFLICFMNFVFLPPFCFLQMVCFWPSCINLPETKQISKKRVKNIGWIRYIKYYSKYWKQWSISTEYGGHRKVCKLKKCYWIEVPFRWKGYKKVISGHQKAWKIDYLWVLKKLV